MGVSVADYYDGKSILIAGGCGFLGKVLLEKLLYSCPKIDKIYLLMRDKRGICIQQRLDALFEKPLFTRLKKENPQAFKKVLPVASDISKKNLGLSVEEETNLIDKVSIVYHLAATTKFNDPIELTFNINVNGTERILNLSKRMKNIQKFVYVSTTYSNADRSIIDEIVYPQPISLEAIKKRLVVGLDDNEIKKFLGGKPNIYTFTKALAEDHVKRNHGHVPAIIVRPSIVTASLAEPLEGWIDTWAGASGVVSAIGLGLNRVLFGKFSNILDVIPVDYVINLMIVAAVTSTDNLEEVPVYNSCSSELNPITLKTFIGSIVEHSIKNKIYKRLRPGVVMSTFKSKVYLISLFQQVLPSYLADMSLSLRGDEKKYMKAVKKLLIIQKVLEPFTSNSWVIRAQRTRALAESLSVSDKAIFPFNPEDIVWPEYMHVFCDGLKKYMVKS